MLALHAVLVFAPGIEPRDGGCVFEGGCVFKREPVPAKGLFGHEIHADSAHARRCAHEVAIHERGAQSHRLPQLGATVTLQSGDAHLRHDLEKTLAERLYVALLGSGTVRFISGGGGLRASHCGDSLESQVRVHRARAVGDEQRQMRDLSRFAGLGDETHAPAQSLANEMMVHRRDRERRRDRSLVRTHLAVAQNENPTTLVDRA